MTTIERTPENEGETADCHDDTEARSDAPDDSTEATQNSEKTALEELQVRLYLRSLSLYSGSNAMDRA